MPGGQIGALVVTAPQAVRQHLRGLTGKHGIRACVALRPDPTIDPAAAHRLALRSAAYRWIALQAEIDEVDAELGPLVTAAAPTSSRCPASASIPPGDYSSPPGLDAGLHRSAPGDSQYADHLDLGAA